MHRSFEKNLGILSGDAKRQIAQELKSQPLQDEEQDLEAQLGRMVQEFASTRQIKAPENSENVNPQKEIYTLQVEKQRIMRGLYAKLKLIDLEAPIPTEGEDWPDIRHVRYDQGEYRTDKDEQVTRGDLLTDAEWGIHYDLDPATVDRRVRKQYVIEEAKRELRDLLNWQIYFDETSSDRVHDHTKTAYRALFTDPERRQEQPGVVIEKMVRLMLKKLSHDYDLDIEVINTDAYDDVIKKFDFIIRRTDCYRGVRTEENMEAVGIQFTVNQNWEAVEHKQSQVARARSYLSPADRVDDIILVQLSSDVSGSLYEGYQAWKGSGMAGGPDGWWGLEIKETIFRNVLRDILEPAEIDEQWQKIAADERI